MRSVSLRMTFGFTLLLGRRFEGSERGPLLDPRILSWTGWSVRLRWCRAKAQRRVIARYCKELQRSVDGGQNLREYTCSLVRQQRRLWLHLQWGRYPGSGYLGYLGGSAVGFPNIILLASSDPFRLLLTGINPTSHPGGLPYPGIALPSEATAVRLQSVWPGPVPSFPGYAWKRLTPWRTWLEKGRFGHVRP